MQNSKQNKREWKIDTYNKDWIIHKTCKELEGYSRFDARKKDGFFCCVCKKPIPDYIVFQWKLLNE